MHSEIQHKFETLGILNSLDADIDFTDFNWQIALKTMFLQICQQIHTN